MNRQPDDPGPDDMLKRVTSRPPMADWADEEAERRATEPHASTNGPLLRGLAWAAVLSVIVIALVCTAGRFLVALIGGA